MRFDPSITQRVREAIRTNQEVSATEQQLWKAIENNAAKDEELEKRIRALEIGFAQRVTDTGVQKTIELKTGDMRSSMNWLMKLFWIVLLGMVATDVWLRR